MTSIYELQAPTEWATAPTTWSSTTLDEVAACPRRWQLLHSRWGEYERFPVRLHPAAIEGQIVHEALDRLARACGMRGNPPFGSPLFAEATEEANFFGGFAAAITDWQARLAFHPRPGPPFRLRASAQELANRAVRLFREQYRPGNRAIAKAPTNASDGAGNLVAMLHAKRSLTEVRIRHATLPFVGILDRVWLGDDGIEIVDFKTGKPSEAHRAQLIRYATLWWRMTSQAPVRVRAQYLDGDQAWAVDPTSLAAFEEGIRVLIADLTDILSLRPASALPGPNCQRCPVRARCAEGWAQCANVVLAKAGGDIQLKVATAPGPHGFLGVDNQGKEVAVVYEAAIAALLPLFRGGEAVRIVDGVWRETSKEIEVKTWTELFKVLND